MASSYPDLFDQIFFDFTEYAGREDDGKPTWKKPGETASEARDRLRAEREAAKARAVG